MTITALPSLSRISPTFKEEVDTFFGTQLPTFSVEAEAARVEINNNTIAAAASEVAAELAQSLAETAAQQAQNIADAPQYTDLSTSNLTVGTGSKVFTVTAGKSWVAGMLLVAANGSNTMTGTVTSYVGTTLTLNVTVITGSGTFASWSIRLSPMIINGQGGATQSGNVTLTSSSGGAQKITSTAPGQYVTLPDATTCVRANNLFMIDNVGDYDYGVKTNTGVQLGWVRARSSAIIGLVDNSTVAGSWISRGLEKIGITAKYINSTIGSLQSELIRRVALDANRSCFIFGGGNNCYAIIYDASTLTWGSATLIGASTANDGFIAVLSATDQVLVCTFNVSAMEAVTLTTSGTTITVNSGTKATATLSNSLFETGQLIAVGSSWVISYGVTTPANGIRAISISGTTPTIGAESTLPAANNVPANLYASGSVVRTISTSASLLYARPYTVSGSTLTLGAGPVTSGLTDALYRSFLNGNGNIVVQYINTTHFGAVVKLTGTSEVISPITVGTVPTAAITGFDCIPITSSKTLLVGAAGGNWYANILTDTSGTASAGSQATGASAGTIVQAIAVSGNNVRIGVGTQPVTIQITLDCSGSSPTYNINTSLLSIPNSNGGLFEGFISSDKTNTRQFNILYAGTSMYKLSQLGRNYNLQVTPNSFNMASFIGGVSITGVVGAQLSETWFSDQMAGANNTGYYINRVEAVE